MRVLSYPDVNEALIAIIPKDRERKITWHRLEPTEETETHFHRKSDVFIVIQPKTVPGYYQIECKLETITHTPTIRKSEGAIVLKLKAGEKHNLKNVGVIPLDYLVVKVRRNSKIRR